MKRIISLLFTFLFFTLGKINAQKVNVNIATTGYHGDVMVFDPAVNYNPKTFLSIIHLDKNGSATYTADLSKPRYMVFYFSNYNYTLYLSPGDDLLFKIKFTDNVPAISVSGKGSNDNQPEIFALTNIDLMRFYDDKTPGRVIATIKSQEVRNTSILKQYIRHYKPSRGFIKNARLNCQYFALCNYYDFYHHRKLQTPENNPYYKKWQSIEDSLLIKHPINNDDALTSFNYEQLTNLYQFQEPQILIYEAKTKGDKSYAGGRRNLFVERFINKHFSGKAAELAYAQMLRLQLRFNHYEYLDVVFTNFKHKYPSSSYIPVFSNAIAGILAKQKQGLNSKMVFVADDGTKLNTLEDVMRLMKGKTAFVDMWGTWCSPCREELEKYSPQIRDHFKSKNITFLYIANKDIRNAAKWKKTIAYYKINGTHILANQNLDKDIMTKIRATGYPTHFIIKKDGSFKKIKTQDEFHTQQVIKEIEAEM